MKERRSVERSLSRESRAKRSEGSRSASPNKDRRVRKSPSGSTRSSVSGRRSRSKSPKFNPRRGGGRHGERVNAEPSSCIGVFGMPSEVDEHELEDLFSKFGEIESIKLIKNHDSGISKGFCFINFANINDAVEAKEKMNNYEIRNRFVRVDFALPKPARREDGGGFRDGNRGALRERQGFSPEGRYNNRRSPSPGFKGRRDRSDSRERRSSRRRDDSRERRYSDRRRNDSPRRRYDDFHSKRRDESRDKYSERRGRYEESRHGRRSRSPRRSVSPRRSLPYRR
uniref:RRM domain-containing protein n=1 Tax=Parastrongyloides trichosuri TaxID=131310 RepID=A0A0N4ZKC0_PARTI